MANVSYIQIFDRFDCCQNRLDGAMLYVGNSETYTQNTACPGGPYTFSTVTQAMAQAAGVQPAQAYALKINCPLVGRYMQVRAVCPPRHPCAKFCTRSCRSTCRSTAPSLVPAAARSTSSLAHPLPPCLAPCHPRLATMQFVVLAATCLNVAEIQVFSATPNPNAANALALVSYKKACAMSSAYGGASPSYPCSNAVDGDLLNFVHTNAPPTAGELAVGGPWYQIDLGYSMTVSQITIYDRSDCCQNRLDGGRLFVGNYAGDQYAQNAMCPGSPYVLSTITAAQAATQGLAYAYAKTVPCSLTGRFVIFQTPYNVNNPMNLGELQVWSKVCPARTSVGAAPVPGSGCAPECGSVSGIQAEGTFLTLIAPLGCQFTSVAFASFGTPSLTSPTPQSPYSYNSACHSPNSLAIAASCVGLSSCTISVALASFGSDPCFGVAKSLAVTMTTAQPTVGAGALCVHQCSAGYVPVSGAASAVCSGGVWSQPPLNCAPTCDDVPAPANAAYGVQTYFVDDFNVDGSLARLLSLSPATQAIGYPSNNPPRAFLPSARACNVPPEQPAQPLSSHTPASPA